MRGLRQATGSALPAFCSRRCANVDLGRWLKGNYAIPSRETPEFRGDFPGDDPSEE